MEDIIDNVDNSLGALLKLENEASEKKQLFDKEKNISLKISLFRMPKMRGIRKKYLRLRHSRFGDDPEICLFVPNRRTDVEYKISTDDCIDFTVDYFENFLRKHKVKGIKTIMPLKQLQSEYGPYELRRKLVDRFDIFLCKNSLLYNQRFLKAVGKYFIKKNKEPLGISFPAKDASFDEKFNENVRRAILSTTFRIKPSSDNYAIPIGTLSQPVDHLKDNIEEVLNQIMAENVIPGGFPNIKGMYLGTSTVGGIPLYICKEFPGSLKAPKVKSRRPKVKTVRGEITSLPGKEVIVKPSGDVIINKIYTKTQKKGHCNYRERNQLQFDNIEEESSDDEKNTNGNDCALGKKKIIQSKQSDSEDEDDDEIEKREAQLLRQSKLLKGRDEESDESEYEEAEEPPKKIQKTEKLKTKKNKNLKKKTFKKSAQLIRI